MIYSHVEGFHNKSRFYSNSNNFLVVQNSFLIVEKLAKVNHKKNAKTISTFDFSIRYTSIPNNFLIKVLNEIISIVFNCMKKTRVRFSELSVNWNQKKLTNDILHSKV